MFATDATQVMTTAVVGLSVVLALILLAMTALPDPYRYSAERFDRRRILGEIMQLPLLRMLRLRGLTPEQFIARLSQPRLQQVTSNCRGCTCKARCEAVLQGYIAAGDYAFCPNRDTIARAAQVMAAA